MDTSDSDDARREVLVLANSDAGSADEQSAGVREAIAERVEATFEAPDGPEDMGRVLAEAGGRDVVVLGGDGSLHACLQALHTGDLLDRVGAVGLVPLGTGNDFARGQGIPLDPIAAVDVALSGAPTRMGLLVDDEGDVVVNVVHAGVGAEATAHAADVKGLLGRAAYAAGAARAGLGNPGWHLEVSVDDEVVVTGEQRTLLVSIALGPSVGGGTPVAPAADPGSDRAQVILSTASGLWNRVSFARDLRHGRHTEREDVRSLPGRTVRVRADRPGESFRLNADGEVSPRRTDATWTLHPRAWTARLPT